MNIYPDNTRIYKHLFETSDILSSLKAAFEIMVLFFILSFYFLFFQLGFSLSSSSLEEGASKFRFFHQREDLRVDLRVDLAS